MNERERAAAYVNRYFRAADVITNWIFAYFIIGFIGIGLYAVFTWFGGDADHTGTHINSSDVVICHWNNGTAYQQPASVGCP